MSGRDAMTVCCTPTPIAGCSASQSALCHAFARTFVRSAAGVIGGQKPAALFSLRSASAPSSSCELAEVIDVYARELARYGLVLLVLGQVRDRIMFLAYSERAVAQLLMRPENRKLLAAYRHPTRSSAGLMGSLARRLVAYYRRESAGFPHELGLVLGYPLEDVLGYLHGGRETCRGPWRAYGDEAVARRLFERLERCEAQLKRRYAAGASLATLLASRKHVPGSTSF